MAAQTCKRWHRLLSSANSHWHEDVACFTLYNDDDEKRRFKLHSLPNLLGHIGRCKQATVSIQILPLVSSCLSDLLISHRLKIDAIYLTLWNNFDLSGHFLVLPSSLIALNVGSDRLTDPDIDWLRTLELKKLTLKNIALRESVILTQTLKYLRYALASAEENSTVEENDCETNPLQSLLSHLPQCILLEELVIEGLFIDDKSFGQLLHIIGNDLFTLHSISFEWVYFGLTNIDYSKLADFGLLSQLKMVKFQNCYGNWHIAAKIFTNTFSLDTVVISATTEYWEEIHILVPMLNRKGTAIQLTLNAYSGGLRTSVAPLGFNEAITKLNLEEIKVTQNLYTTLSCGIFEKMTHLRLAQCIGLNDSLFCVLAQFCVWLQNICIYNCSNMLQNCFMPFLQYWEERKAKLLSIESLKSIEIGNCFAIDFDKEKGEFEDGKQWMIFRKTFFASDRPCTRLVIRDSRLANFIDESFDHKAKVLVCKDYSKERMQPVFAFNVSLV